jgi:prolyl 4-hydroxylase
MERTNIANGIFSVDQFLDTDECNDFVGRAEGGAYESAPIISATGTRVDERTRNNDRQIWDDVSLAEKLWSRASIYVPEIVENRRAVGLNERFRLYRYEPGQRFTWHADMPFRRGTGEISLLTFMVYLNQGYEGGATRFEAAKVVGQIGTALFFEHGLIHEGAEVTKGVKYVLRSDVMFGQEGANVA